MGFFARTRPTAVIIACALTATSCSLVQGDGDTNAVTDFSVETQAPEEANLPTVLTASTNRDFWYTQEVSFTGNAFSDRVDLLADRPTVLFGELDWDKGEHLVLTVPLGRETDPVTAQAWIQRSNPLPIIAEDAESAPIDYSATVSVDLTRTAELLSSYVADEDGCQALRAGSRRGQGSVSACDGVLQFRNDSTQFLRDQLGALLVSQPFDPVSVFTLTRESVQLWSWDPEEEILTDVGVNGLNGFGISAAQAAEQARIAAAANDGQAEGEQAEEEQATEPAADETATGLDLAETLGAGQGEEPAEEPEDSVPARQLALDEVPTRLAEELSALENFDGATYYYARVPMIDAVQAFDVNLSEVFGIALEEDTVIVGDDNDPVGQRGVIRVRDSELSEGIAGEGELLADDDDLFEGAFGLFEQALGNTFADIIIEVGNGDPGVIDPVTSDSQIVRSNGQVHQVVRSVAAQLNFRPVLEDVLRSDTLLWLRIRELGVQRGQWDERVDRFLERPDAFESIFRFKMTIDRYAGEDGITLAPPTFNTIEGDTSRGIFDNSVVTANVLRYGTSLATGPIDGDPDIDRIEVSREVPDAANLSRQGFTSDVTGGQPTWIDFAEPEALSNMGRIVCEAAEAAGDAGAFEDGLTRVWSLNAETTLITARQFRDWAISSLQFFCPDISAVLYETGVANTSDGDAGGDFDAENPNRNLFSDAADAVTSNSNIELEDLPVGPFPDRVQVLADSGLLNSDWASSLSSSELILLGETTCAQIQVTEELVDLTQFLLEAYDTRWKAEVGYNEWISVTGGAAFVTCPRDFFLFITGI